MRRFIAASVTALALSATPLDLHGQVAPASTPARPTIDSSAAAAVLLGRAAAERPGMGGRFAGGFASGFFLGLIGTGIAYAVAGSSDASLPALEAAQLSPANSTYQLAYQQGYRERLQSRRKNAALTGGLLGTATIVVLLVSAQ